MCNAVKIIQKELHRIENRIFKISSDSMVHFEKFENVTTTHISQPL
jgi:hypothetical protein